jgi:hypothetical protein
MVRGIPSPGSERIRSIGRRNDNWEAEDSLAVATVCRVEDQPGFLKNSLFFEPFDGHSAGTHSSQLAAPDGKGISEPREAASRH